MRRWGLGTRDLRRFRITETGSNAFGTSNPPARAVGFYYVGESSAGYQKLWILTVYKKESQEVPKHILERAKARKTSHQAKLAAQKLKEKNR